MPSPRATHPGLSPAKRALLEAMRDARNSPSSIVRRAHEGDVPLSFGQEGLYFLDRMQPGSAYNVHTRLRLTGAVDEAALERALGEIVRRHEVLRTRFRERDGVPVQVVAPFAGFALPVEDLSTVADAEREARVRRRASEDAEIAFDLATGPLFRATLLRLGAEERELLLCIHHIVTDGWSMEIFRRELSLLYAAYVAGGESPLAEPAVQYADYAVWQRQQLRDAALNREIAWWRERLADAPERLELPTDRPRPAVRTDRGGWISAALPTDVVERVEALALAEGGTLFVALLGAFQLLLSMYGVGDDVVVGTPVAGRTRKETEGLIGYFANTLVIRTDVGGDPTVRELVRRVRDGVMDAYAHQEVPFERLVAKLRPERSPGHSPLFQVLFSLDDMGGGSPLPGLAIHTVGSVERETAKFDLILTCSRGDGGMEGALGYSTDLFDRETAERMLRHLGRLLEQWVADPDRRVSAVELLTEVERGRIPAESVGPIRPYPSEPIQRLIEAQAARTPDAVALMHEGVRITYAQLNGGANRLARELRTRGVGRGAFIPVLAERGPHVAIAMLAVMKSGAAFVPLDAAWPEDRLRRILDDLRAHLMLAGEDVADRAWAFGTSVVTIPTSIGGDGAPDLEGDPEPGEPIYAIYTSGSTGAPKAAIATHSGIANRFHWMTECFGAESAACVLQTTRHVYDSAVWQLLWPLTVGGRTVIPRSGAEADAGHLAELIHGEGVTMTDFVPSVFNALVPELAIDPCARERLASLRTLIVGGEQISAETTHRFLECFPEVRVMNLYGPTECSIGTIHHPVTAGDGGRIPIGRPIANTSAVIVDRAGRWVPPGVAGELYLGGRCVGLGYLGDARKTAAAFVPDPYAHGGRLYRTGDRARRRADGSIEYLGRLDEQVKIRGFRIEPGEIEAALLRFPGVRGARVLAREAPSGERRLVAYVAAGEPETVHGTALREQLRVRLPDHMIPAAFVVLPALPLTPGGKVDRAALPPPRWESGEAHVAPRTPAEEILAEIWREVLAMDRVGMRDGFFELGGHSLLATRVISRVRRAFGVEVPLRALFENPTVAGLAEHVQAALASNGGARPLPLRRVSREGDPPASFGQERLWRAFRANPADTSFNLHYGVRVRGALNVPALERALTALVGRHEPLRTTFREADRRVMQVIHPPAPVDLRQADVSARSVTERESAVAALTADEAARRFDLERGPLLRVLLVRLGEQDFAILLTLHHVVTDGWSTGVLMRELSALYEAYAEGREPVLPGLEVRYADYAAWQRAWLSGEVLERQLAYWSAQLSGAPRLLAIPTDRPRSPAIHGWGAARTFEVGEALSESLRVLAREEGCTLYMTLLAGFQALLSRASDQDDISIGTPIAGRMQREVEGLVGFFTNTLVIRTSLSGTPSFRLLLQRVREATLGAYAHQDLPFALLAAALRPECAAEEMPLFQAVFELDHARTAEDSLRLPGADVIPLPRPSVEQWRLRSELRLTMLDEGGRIEGRLLYRAELFDADTIDRMIRDYLALLEAAVADPDRPTAEVPLVGAVAAGPLLPSS